MAWAVSRRALLHLARLTWGFTITSIIVFITTTKVSIPHQTEWVRTRNDVGHFTRFNHFKRLRVGFLSSVLFDNIRSVWMKDSSRFLASDLLWLPHKHQLLWRLSIIQRRAWEWSASRKRVVGGWKPTNWWGPSHGNRSHSPNGTEVDDG